MSFIIISYNLYQPSIYQAFGTFRIVNNGKIITTYFPEPIEITTAMFNICCYVALFTDY